MAKNFLSAANQLKACKYLEENWERIEKDKPAKETVAEEIGKAYECTVSVANLDHCLKACELKWPKGAAKVSPVDKFNDSIRAMAVQIDKLCKKNKVDLTDEFKAVLYVGD